MQCQPEKILIITLLVLIPTTILILSVMGPNNLITQNNINVVKLRQFLDSSNTSNVYTSCGGVIQVNRKTPVYIEYKLQSTFEGNELCVWTVRNVDSASLHFFKTISSFQSYAYIQISTFNDTSRLGPLQSVTMGRTNEPEHIDISASLALIIFSSSSAQGNGFRIEIGVFDKSPFSYTSNDFFANSYIGNTAVSLPLNVMWMTAFVISPLKAHWNDILVTYPKSATFSAFQLEPNGTSINFRVLRNQCRLNGTNSYLAVSNTTVAIIGARPRDGNSGAVTLNWHACMVNECSAKHLLSD